LSNSSSSAQDGRCVVNRPTVSASLSLSRYGTGRANEPSIESAVVVMSVTLPRSTCSTKNVYDTVVRSAGRSIADDTSQLTASAAPTTTTTGHGAIVLRKKRDRACLRPATAETRASPFAGQRQAIDTTARCPVPLRERSRQTT
jgi:hypothetical protein